jgi:hypothetical protein
VLSGEATNTNFIIWFEPTAALTHDLPHVVHRLVETVLKKLGRTYLQNRFKLSEILSKPPFFKNKILFRSYFSI